MWIEEVRPHCTMPLRKMLPALMGLALYIGQLGSLLASFSCHCWGRTAYKDASDSDWKTTLLGLAAECWKLCGYGLKQLKRLRLILIEEQLLAFGSFAKS